MTSLPTLRRELVAALALVFAGALTVATVGVILLISRLTSPLSGTLYITLLLAADVVVFLWFGHYLVQRRVLRPIERMLAGVEAIAAGDYTAHLPRAGTADMSRLAEAVDRMA